LIPFMVQKISLHIRSLVYILFCQCSEECDIILEHFAFFVTGINVMAEVDVPGHATSW
jgi:hypothetical protein